MPKKYVTIISLLVMICCLAGCAFAGGHGMAGSIIYPKRVPASFETMILCKVAYRDDISFQWSCDNGTINGDGSTVTWVAPGATGRCNINLELVDKTGNEERHAIAIDVVDFAKNVVDSDTNIAFRFPIWGDAFIAEQFCINPATTLEISVDDPLSIRNKYSWSSNGGKMMGQGIKDNTAKIVGWTSPGVAGNYTVEVMATDRLGDVQVGHLFVYVKAPSCCGR
jgi:hypothetical protein